jgi:CDP-diacylglycerol--serine O-phosphatidyltransferase
MMTHVAFHAGLAVVRYRRQPQHLPHGADPDSPPPPRKRRRGVAILPSLFTLGNCLCGFAAIHYAASQSSTQPTTLPGTALASPYAIAGYFIFAAMIFDMFDGFVARLTRSASDFGAELDSLADMVSFGVAPAFLSIRLITDLLHKINVAPGTKTLDIPGPFSDHAWGRLFWIIAALYVSCTALRLARFNVINKHEVSSHMNFRGMPSPGAAAIVASTIIFFETLYAPRHLLPFNIAPPILEMLKTFFPYLLPVVLLIAALLMVSRFQYSHLINRFLRGRKKFRHLVVYLFIFMLILLEPRSVTLAAIYAYALSAPLTWLFRKATGRVPAPHPAAVTPPPAPPPPT